MDKLEPLNQKEIADIIKTSCFSQYPLCKEDDVDRVICHLNEVAHAICQRFGRPRLGELQYISKKEVANNYIPIKQYQKIIEELKELKATRLEELEKNDRNKDMLAEKIYNTIYRDKKPKQEMSAKLECLVLAEDVLSWFCAKFGRPNCKTCYLKIDNEGMKDCILARDEYIKELKEENKTLLEITTAQMHEILKLKDRPKEDYTTHAIAKKLGVELWKVMELGKYFKEKFGKPKTAWCNCPYDYKPGGIVEVETLKPITCAICHKPIKILTKPSISRERLVEELNKHKIICTCGLTHSIPHTPQIADDILKEMGR